MSLQEETVLEGYTPSSVLVGGAFLTWEMDVTFSHFCPRLFHNFSRHISERAIRDFGSHYYSV